jgi:hypothetical protein
LFPPGIHQENALIATAAQPLTLEYPPVGADESDDHDGFRTAAGSLIERASALAGAAAIHLGLSEADADTVYREGLFAVAGVTVAVVPVAEVDDGSLLLLLTADTGRAVSGMTSAMAESMLQQAPGLLLSYAVALGSSPDGHWVVNRSIKLRPDQPKALAKAIVSMPHLVNFAINAADAAQGEGGSSAFSRRK